MLDAPHSLRSVAVGELQSLTIAQREAIVRLLLPTTRTLTPEGNICYVLPGNRPGHTFGRVSHVVIDSVASTDAPLVLALVGKRSDGHRSFVLHLESARPPSNVEYVITALQTSLAAEATSGLA